jgi:Lrp/AsnC family transcriptional regulator, regulator for asnA, asnC and gidA
LDKLDYLLLSELLNDATLSFVAIGKKLGASPYTIRRRHEKLKKDGMIYKSIVSINLAKLGYQGKAFLLITVGPNANKSETITYLKTVKNIIVVTELIGPYEILAIAPISDLRSVHTLVKEARRAQNIWQIKIACINNADFPIGPNFGTMLSKKAELLDY